MDWTWEEPLYLAIDRGPLIAQEREVEMRFSVQPDVFWGVAEDGPIYCSQLAEELERMVQSPDAIFLDLKRPNFDNGLCYSGSLGTYMDEKGRKHTFNTHHVLLGFAAIVDEDIRFFAWTDRMEDRHEPGLPVNWRADFGEPLWRKE